MRPCQGNKRSIRFRVLIKKRYKWDCSFSHYCNPIGPQVGHMSQLSLYATKNVRKWNMDQSCTYLVLTSQKNIFLYFLLSHLEGFFCSILKINPKGFDVQFFASNRLRRQVHMDFRSRNTIGNAQCSGKSLFFPVPVLTNSASQKFFFVKTQRIRNKPSNFIIFS